MTQRERAKEENRRKIKETAARIIREEGMEKLTMRRLAEAAGVSLRTPYNLFGSKTDVLVALIDDVREQIEEGFSERPGCSVVEGLFRFLDSLGRFVSADEEFYREIYREIMISDHQEARLAGYEQLIALVRPFIAEAIHRGELGPDVDADALGEHLGVLFMAVLGMWASRFFDMKTCMRHVRQSWAAQLGAAPSED